MGEQIGICAGAQHGFQERRQWGDEGTLPHLCPSRGCGSAPLAPFSTSFPHTLPGDGLCFRADNSPFELLWVFVSIKYKGHLRAPRTMDYTVMSEFKSCLLNEML